MANQKLTLEQRFWAKVDRRADDECWPWVGSKTHRGYGEIWCGGRTQRAPRVSWSIANGVPFPADKLACHTCDNPVCVNPAHIWPGTMSENIKDAVAKGRHVPGPGESRHTVCNNGHALTADNVYQYPNGTRNCRACRRNRDAAARTEQRKRKAVHER